MQTQITREQIEEAIDKAMIAAEWNQCFIDEPGGFASRGDRFDGDNEKMSKFDFWMAEPLVNRKIQRYAHIFKNNETGARGFEISVSGFEAEDFKDLKADDILADQEVARTFFGELENIQQRYHFKYDDIVSGKSALLSPEGSNVGKHITDYVMKLADMLDGGIKGEAWNRDKYGYMGITPMTISLSRFAGDTKFKFYFNSQTNSVHEVSVDSALAKIKPATIKAHKHSIPLSSRGQYLLRILQQMALPETLHKWTAGLNQNASFEDVAEVIQFKASCKGLMYDGKKAELEAGLVSINERIAGRGCVYEGDAPANNDGADLGRLAGRFGDQTPPL